MNVTSSVLVAACLALPVSHTAAARPGTPKSVGVSQCAGNASNSPEIFFGQLPRVCVFIENTARQPVSFDAEMAVNGVPVAPSSFSKKVDCLDKRECVAGFNFGQRLPYGHRTSKVSNKMSAIPIQAFFLRDLEFDTKYCFRFRARDEDGMVSELWTQWDCVHTKPAPPAPAAPAIAVQYVPAGWNSSKRAYEHDKVVVTWPPTRDRVANYTVNGSSPDKTYGEQLPKIINAKLEAHSTSAEFVIPPMSKNGRAPDIRVVVCAQNYSGTRCSSPVSARPVSAVVDMAREGNGSSFGSSARKIPAETTPVAAAVPAPSRPVTRGSAATAGTASVARATPSMEFNTDRPGSDYSSAKLSGDAAPEQCGTRCAADATCKAWTFVKPGVQGSAAMCYLKRAVPQAFQNGCCVSGVTRR